MNKTLIVLLSILGAIVLVVLLLVGAVIGDYNTLVTKQQGVQSKWSQVENQMQRRADLIPNIVETVKGYAGVEERTMTKVAEARSHLLSTMQNPASTTEDKIAADSQLTTAMQQGGLLGGGGILGNGGRFLSITEQYPQLQSNQNFLRLQDELTGTENRLAVARGDYTNTAQDYNTTRSSFPTVIVANFAGFPVQPYFKADESARTAPKVNFGNSNK
jgi:LemA protein